MFLRNTFIKAAAAVSVASALMLGTVACSSDDEGGDTVRMATQPWLGYGPWYVADEKGYFRDNGVDVEITSFDTDADMMAAIGGGRVDVANVASHSALQMVESGLDVSIVLMLDTSLEADAILAGPEITSIDQLAGSQVAFEEGGVSNLLLGYALEQSGLTLADITPVPMAPKDAAAALISGQVPAAVTYEPYISSAAGSGDFEQIYTAAENPGLISDVLVVSNDALANKEEQIRNVVASWGPAIEFYESDQEEAQQIIAAAVGSDPESLRPAFAGVRFYSLAGNQAELTGNYATNVLPDVHAVALQAGILEDASTNVGALIDDRFLP